MKLVSWNVAGFRACLKKGFVEFFNEVDADIFCLSEVKATKDQYDFSPEGYYEYLYPAERKGYSGTLIYSKEEPLDVFYGFGEEESDSEGRTITLEFNKFYLVNIYVPNVKRDLSRLKYRMYWQDEFKEYVSTLEEVKPVVICGDFNVANEEIDIKNAKANKGNAGFTDEEREKFKELLNEGFVDTYRYFYPTKEEYSWWSYLNKARERNIGWRIDYFLVTETIINKVKNPKIYTDVYGSDHAPVGINLDVD